MSDNAPDGDQPASPWTQKGFIASAVVVGLLLVLGAVLVFTGPGDSQADPPETPTTSSSMTATSEPPDGQDSACGLPEGDQTVLTTAPEGTEWELVGTIAAPTAPEVHGPGEVDEGLRTCFARTPTGALYAAANFLATTSAPELREPLIQELAASGPGRDAALAALAQEGEQEADGSGTQIVGFSFLNYDSASTTVDLALRGFSSSGSGGFAHLPLTLRWEDDAWKVVLPQDGDVGRAIQGIPDLTGYVPWSGS